MFFRLVPVVPRVERDSAAIRTGYLLHPASRVLLAFFAVRLVIAAGAQRPQVREVEGKLRVCCDRLNMVDPRLAQTTDIGAADNATEIVPPQCQFPD